MFSSVHTHKYIQMHARTLPPSISFHTSAADVEDNLGLKKVHQIGHHANRGALNGGEAAKGKGTEKMPTKAVTRESPCVRFALLSDYTSSQSEEGVRGCSSEGPTPTPKSMKKGLSRSKPRSRASR